MSNGKHSFVQMTKLHNVRGRVDYITNPKRQENLYATYTNVPKKYWYHLAKENQWDFSHSGSGGRCIEARELIIMLPPSLIEYDHETLLKYFTGRFAEKYGVDCQSALHHNKAKTNLHIHLIFSEHKALGEPERKIARRNMFYDENGKHVRTKKEILDEEGNVRKGCRIIPKGEVYEINFFEPKNPHFKSQSFLKESKEFFTEICNTLVKNENEKLAVFESNGPYLATKKIGKNNPKATQIRQDNYLRQEWNRTVDRMLIWGEKEEAMMFAKNEYILKPMAESVEQNGYRPELFTEFLQKAIGLVRGMIDYCIACDNAEKDENGEPLFYEDLVIDATPAALPPREKGPYPSSEKEEAELLRLKSIEKKLKKENRKVYAIEKNKEKMEKQLADLPKNIFHRKERRELTEAITAKDIQLEEAKSTLGMMPVMYGYANVKEFKKDLKRAEEALAEVRARQKEWERPDPVPEKAVKIFPANAKRENAREDSIEEELWGGKQRSIKEQLEENKEHLVQQKNKTKKKYYDRDCL